MRNNDKNQKIILSLLVLKINYINNKMLKLILIIIKIGCYNNYVFTISPKKVES